MTEHAKPTPDDGSSLPRRPTAEETAERRGRAWRMRTEYGMNTETIAKALGCHRTTVSRMLSTVSRQLRRQYEAGGRFNPAEVVATKIDQAERVRRLAMQTYVTSGDDRAKMRALLVALRADQQAIGLLQDVSLLPRDFGVLRLEAGRARFNASEIGRLARELHERRLMPPPDETPDDLVPAGERAFLRGDVIDTETDDE